jgi:hypothetical protein
LADNSVLNKTVRLIRVFVASPGDVQEERQRFSTVVASVNKRHAIEKGILLDPWQWEIDSVPTIGRPQEDINPSLDEAAVVVLMIWNRIGTPSGKAESGTVEEFERAVERFHRDGWPHVLVYYCNRPVPPAKNSEEIEQAMQVMKFKEKHAKDLLPATYNSTEDFAQLLETHLDRVVDKISSAVLGGRTRKVLYVKVTCLRDKRAAGVEPLYTREVDRLYPDVRNCPVYDESVYYTLEIFPEGRKPTPRIDRSSGVVDPRLVMPFQHPIQNKDADATTDPHVISYEIAESCNAFLTVSHFVNGLQGDDQYIATRLTDDVEYIRLIVDFSSVPNADDIVQPGTAALISDSGNRDLPVAPYGESMYMIYCENASRGDLIRFNLHFNWPKPS